VIEIAARISSGSIASIKTVEPLDHHAERQTHIARLHVVLRLLGAGEQPRRERTHIGQGRNLIGQLVHRHGMILLATQQEHVLPHQV